MFFNPFIHQQLISRFLFQTFWGIDKTSLNMVKAIFKMGKKIYSIDDFGRELDQKIEKDLTSLYSLYNEWQNSSFSSLSKREEISNFVHKLIESEQRIQLVETEETGQLLLDLRNRKTSNAVFSFYTVRCYEILTRQLLHRRYTSPECKNNILSTDTPVEEPCQQVAFCDLPTINDSIKNGVIAVLLRGALLPSLVLGHEIHRYTGGVQLPYALFRIKRNDEKKHNNMEYFFDEENSYFDCESLHGKDLFFADPMNATAGSLLSIVAYLKERGVKPSSITTINLISSSFGALKVVRSLTEGECYTMTIDPVMNDKAYILPGLGDAGDRLNGADDPNSPPRSVAELLDNYESIFSSVYGEQINIIKNLISS